MTTQEINSPKTFTNQQAKNLHQVMEKQEAIMSSLFDIISFNTSLTSKDSLQESITKTYIDLLKNELNNANNVLKND